MEQYALITGASSGIGRAIAFELARDGYHLVITAKNADQLQQVAQELSTVRPGISVIPIAKDLTKPGAAHELYSEVEGKAIHIETLVNDAGVGQWGEFASIPFDKYRYIIRLNVEALAELTSLFLPRMLERGSGRILNLGSVAGFQPGPLLAVYHATKAFVVSFSEALAEELKDRNITVTCLCPGPTATHFFERADMEEAWIVQKGHIMSAEDVARVGYKALKDGERVYIAGAPNKVLTFMRRVIPTSLQARIHKSLYESTEERAS